MNEDLDIEFEQETIDLPAEEVQWSHVRVLGSAGLGFGCSGVRVFGRSGQRTARSARRGRVWGPCARSRRRAARAAR